MEFRVHQKLREKIQSEYRDIALITSPGMGLSTLLNSLSDVDQLPVAWLDVDTLLYYWNIEYKNRKSNRRFVIHAATITALIRSRFVDCNITDKELFSTNLRSFLEAHLSENKGVDTIFIVFDNFAKLPDDLAKLVLNEMKAISDQRNQAEYKIFTSIRYIIGGAVDLTSLYLGATASGVSPATHFCKYKPCDFLLSPKEANNLLDETFPELIKLPDIVQLIIDWSGGYVHFIVEFARWLLKEIQDIDLPSLPKLFDRLREVIEEQDRIPLLKYCYSGWDKVKGEAPLINLLVTVISTGYAYDLSEKGRKLASLGFLIEKPGQRHLYWPINKLIELFLRQRLAERGFVLPIEESTIWAIPSLNAKAYTLIMEIENRLRSYMGDIMFAKYQDAWKTTGFGVNSAKGKNVVDEAFERMQDEQDSIFTTRGVVDPFLTFLDVGDLRAVVEQNPNDFPIGFSTNFPQFLDEINYHRRRIAHNRSITQDQILALESRWNIIRRMMTRRL